MLGLIGLQFLLASTVRWQRLPKIKLADFFTFRWSIFIAQLLLACVAEVGWFNSFFHSFLYISVTITLVSQIPHLLLVQTRIYQRLCQPTPSPFCTIASANHHTGLYQHTHTHSVLMAIFPGEPGSAGCPLNSPPSIPGLCILLGQT